MVEKCPMTIAELANCFRLSDTQRLDFGPKFLEVLKRYSGRLKVTSNFFVKRSGFKPAKTK
jgi:hypothetical protein